MKAETGVFQLSGQNVRLSIPDGAYIKVDRMTWNLLGFALHHQRELAKTLFDSYEALIPSAEEEAP
jgi:hypothetical protein